MFFFRKKHSNPNIRLRFAPSPTGSLHIGGLRTALFAYLLAKSQNGKLILRIEDTDQKREVEGAADSLIRVLKVMGLDFDEGPHIGGEFGPYVQTERVALYKKHSAELLASNRAYRCFCSEERLTRMRADQEAAKRPPRYDRLCRYLSAEESLARATRGEKFVIRQAMPLEGEVIVHDELRGDIKFSASELDDHVLIKTSGIPTYQFANVVDDHLMQISHVTRAVEWLPSYPKNFLLYQAFGWEPPKFIHLPLILNKEGGGKLSKRHGAAFVEEFLGQGYLPEALINFCVLLGWHPKGDKEIWSLEELKKDFTLEGLGVSPSVFDADKLDYFNSHYIRKTTVVELTELCRPYLMEAGLLAPEKVISDGQLQEFIRLTQDRLKKLSDVAELSSFLFERPDFDPASLRWKKISLEESVRCLAEIDVKMRGLDPERWTKDTLESDLIAWIKERGRSNGDYLWPLRYALTGQKFSPGPFEVAAALGREESLRRIDSALALAKKL